MKQDIKKLLAKIKAEAFELRTSFPSSLSAENIHEYILEIENLLEELL